MAGRPRQISPPDTLSGQYDIEQDRQEAHLGSSLGRGLMLLRAFGIGDPYLGNAALAERTGLAKATVSRLTRMLMDLGYLHYRSDLGKYELAPSVLALCHSYLGNMPVPMLARPAMLELAREGQVNVGLGIQDGLRMVYVESAQGEPMSTRQRVGFSIPIALSGMGLACIGGMGEEQRDQILRQIHESSSDEQWQIISAKVEDAVSQVHTHGYYLGVGTLAPRTNMLGVPFSYGRAMLAFNCGGSSPVQTADKLTQLAPRLVGLVEQVRRELSMSPAPYGMR